MQSTDSEVLTYQACCDLGGHVCHIEMGKRGGRVVPLFGPAFASNSQPNGQGDGDQKARQLFKQLSCDLTPTERRTWRKLLLEGKSISQVANEEKVSRTAIYERIRGNSRGQGGMIAKNEFVALWWLRRSLEEDEDAN